MPNQKFFSAAELSSFLVGSGIGHVKVGVFDIDGVLRGKLIHRDKLISALSSGLGFCDVILGWDCEDHLYDSASFTGWRTAFPDATVRLLPETFRHGANSHDIPLILGELVGPAETVCPRAVLRRVLKKADELGYAVKAGVEFEFFVFNETPETIREKRYQQLKPLSSGNFGYSVLRSEVHAELHAELLAFCDRMDLTIECLHPETGPGVLEAALCADEALMAADKASLFKTMTKVFFQRRGLIATFMAKWNPDLPGSSGHLHSSLIDKSTGRGTFFDAGKPQGISDVMRWYIGGQQRLMPDFLAMVACTVNSYSRLVPGFWAPTTATWGYENRTCAIRAIGGSESTQRSEYRVAAADINPYIALAAAIGSGIWGVEHQIEPTAPVVGNAYSQDSGQQALPRTLKEAASALRRSEVATTLFGDEFVDHYAFTREWEEDQARRAVTDWQLARYFEII